MFVCDNVIGHAISYCLLVSCALICPSNTHIFMLSEPTPHCSFPVLLSCTIHQLSQSTVQLNATMDEHNERTSLIRSNTLNRASSPSHNNNNGYNNRNGHHHHHNNNQACPSCTPSSREDFVRRDPRTFLVQVQRSLALFQTWAAKVLHEGEESSVVNWVQNARVARTFMMILNVILVVNFSATLCTFSHALFLVSLFYSQQADSLSLLSSHDYLLSLTYTRSWLSS